MTDLRAVTVFNLAGAPHVIDFFEFVEPDGTRPRQAPVTAEDVVRGGPRSRAQRVGPILGGPSHRVSGPGR